MTLTRYWRIVLPIAGLAVASLFLPAPREQETSDKVAKSSNRTVASPNGTEDSAHERLSEQARPKEETSTEAIKSSESVDQVLLLLPSGCGWQSDEELVQSINGVHESPQEIALTNYVHTAADDAPVTGGNRFDGSESTPIDWHGRPILSATPAVQSGAMRSQHAQPITPQQQPQFAANSVTGEATTTNATTGHQPNHTLPSGNSTGSPEVHPGSQATSNEDPHAEVFSRTLYPSATECAACHKQIYEEWAISNHAYAAISPMFHCFEQKLNDLSQGTIGYFCLRCHAPVATSSGLRRDQAIWDGPRVFREGVTCVACHRVNEQYGKVNGQRRMVTGDLSQPVYGSGHGAGVAEAIRSADYYAVKPNLDDQSTGQTIHREAIQFEQLSRSDFCVSCHQVAVDPQIKLEVVWDQYRASPAYREGITCQDCHMGRVPGVAAGYSIGPSAVINQRVVNPAKKHSNHVFFGPGASIAHPGLFPDNPESDRWTFNDWLQFDWRAGWGTDEFEDRLEAGEFYCDFPPVWSNIDDRYEAREIIDDNQERLQYKNDLRRQTMSNGSQIDGPFFVRTPRLGRNLDLHYVVSNINPGHNMPSGSLGAQPQVWLNVVLIGPDGSRCWESGYLDSNGDLADLHSKDVLHRRLPHDDQLFNLQTKFLTTNVKGTDREMYLPINIDIDQLPFLRPGAQPISVLNHPPFIRMEGHSLPPLGSRRARYQIPAEAMSQPGWYRLSVRMRSRGEPIYFMQFVEATPEMQRAMNESIVNFHEYSVQFLVE